MKILAIAPYLNLKQRIDELKQQFPTVIIDTFLGDLHEGVKIVQELEDNYDLVISRGGTAQKIKEISSLPVIEIEISILDILRVIKLVENYNQNYAFIGFSNITKQVRILAEILDTSLEIITINHRNELPKIFDMLIENNFSLVIGDMVTTTYAVERNINSILLESGAESILTALELAINLGKNLNQEKMKNSFYKKAQKELDFSLIVLDKNLQPKFSGQSKTQNKLVTIIQNLLKSEELQENLPYTFLKKYYGKLYRIELIIKPTEIICYIRPIRLTEYSKAIKLIDSDEPLKNSSIFIGDTQKKVLKAVKSNANILLLGEKGTGKDQLIPLIASKTNFEKKLLIQLEQLTNEEWANLFESEESVLLQDNTAIFLKGMTSLSKNKLSQVITFIRESDYIQHTWIIIFSSQKKNNNLAEIINSQLFYQVDLQPLRKRKDEISSIISLYLYEFNLEFNKNTLGLTPEAMLKMQLFPWPENLKQLKNVCRQIVMSGNTSIVSEDTVSQLLLKESKNNSLISANDVNLSEPFNGLTLQEIQHKIILDLLKFNQGNRTKTAKDLDISRSTLWRILKE